MTRPVVGIIGNQYLINAMQIMHENLEDPLDISEIAEAVQISRRQLERLFKSNLECTPSRYYQRLRLFRARQLLRQTSLSIIEIAALCGFVSTPHFSKCYRTHLGITPREERASVAPDKLGLESQVTDLRPAPLTRQGAQAARGEPHYGSVRLVVDNQGPLPAD